jgi:FkbH-like protein
MFEFDRHEKRRDAAAPREAYTPFDGGRRRAFLFWGEHCTECAAPACYLSCDLYDPRADMRCRRFEQGIFRNTAFPSASGAGAEVLFRRWGKIEARGNARLLDERLVGLAERTAGIAAPWLDRIGALAHRVTRDARWAGLGFSLFERLNRRLARGRKGPLPDAFVAEIYNPGNAPVTLLLSMAVDRTQLGRAVTPDQLPRPVLERLTVPPGYFRQDLPRAAFADLLGSGLPFNMALVPDGGEGAHLVFLTLDFVAFHKAEAVEAAAPVAARPAAKCVVFDLDNTLWDGILLEGPVALRPGVAETIRALDERGILVSIASKNAQADAMAQLAAFGLDDYLLCPAIGWAPKSESVRQIARRLDIGVDSLIFVDDNPFERDEVASTVGIETLPDTALAGLLDHPRLQGAVTAESRTRRQMYRQALERESAAQEHGSDYVEFLRASGVRVSIRRDGPEDFERICELVQRTNQLNFSGRKYKREDVELLLAGSKFERWVIDCADRYGSYGTVGFCLASERDGGVRVEDLMLSCRVQGKHIERALLHCLAQRGGRNAKWIELNFVPTERNGAARAVLAELGFVAAPGGGMRLDPVPDDLEPDFIAIAFDGDRPEIMAAE